MSNHTQSAQSATIIGKGISGIVRVEITDETMWIHFDQICAHGIDYEGYACFSLEKQGVIHGFPYPTSLTRKNAWNTVKQKYDEPTPGGRSIIFSELTKLANKLNTPEFRHAGMVNTLKTKLDSKRVEITDTYKTLELLQNERDVIERELGLALSYAETLLAK